MPTVYDIPADELIKYTAEYLRESVIEVAPTPWAALVKTGVHSDGPPQNPDFWYIRAASILRKVYLRKLIGVGHLRKEYGGRMTKGTTGKHKQIAGGAIIRNILKQLEKAGLVETLDNEGRQITKKGTSILDGLARELLKKIERDFPELKKYG